MDRDQTKEFLKEVVGIYPKFEIMPGTIEAWASRLKDCSIERARELLDKHLASDDGSYTPKLDYFVKGMKPTARSISQSDEEIIFHVGLRAEDVPEGCSFKHLGQGCLYDQWGREYGSLETDLPYYYDEMGRICNGLGRVIQE